MIFIKIGGTSPLSSNENDLVQMRLYRIIITKGVLSLIDHESLGMKSSLPLLISASLFPYVSSIRENYH